MMATIVNADSRKFNKKLIDRARFALFQCKAVKLKHHKFEHEKDIFKIEIGKRYRLVSSDLEQWELLSHETYNHLFAK